MPTPGTLKELASQLAVLSETLAAAEEHHRTPARVKRVRATISETYKKMRQVMDDLDPVKQPDFVFEPSNPDIAGRIVAITMLAQPRKPLSEIERRYGSGVYAIYYEGDFHAYKALSKKEHPIYVGKADPANPTSKSATEQGEKLSARLNEHRQSIVSAKSTLQIDDFQYRALVVQTGYQKSAEDFLIRLFQPIWNNETRICYGIGKHGDSSETRANKRSPWDTLHPGRKWAQDHPKLQDARSEQQILQDIATHFHVNRPVDSIDEILRRFLSEMRAS